MPTPIEHLKAAKEAPNPALLLAWELKRIEQRAGGEAPLDELLALAPAIDEAIAAGRAAEEVVSISLRVLKLARPCSPNAARYVPEGM